MCHQAVATVMNMVVLSMFQKQQEMMGGFNSEKEAAQYLMDTVLEKVEVLLPESQALELLVATAEKEELRTETLNDPAWKSITNELCHAARYQILFHIMTCIGGQTFMLKYEAGMMQKQYLPKMVKTCMDDLVKRYDLSQPDNQKEPPAQLTQIQVPLLKNRPIKVPRYVW